MAAKAKTSEFRALKSRLKSLLLLKVGYHDPRVLNAVKTIIDRSPNKTQLVKTLTESFSDVFPASTFLHS